MPHREKIYIGLYGISRNRDECAQNLSFNCLSPLFEKTYTIKQKRKKSRFLDFEKRKKRKKVKVMTCQVLEATQSVFVLKRRY